MTKPIVIITPVYNDWTSFKQLVQDIDQVASRQQQFVCIVAVNDDSTDTVTDLAIPSLKLSSYVKSIEIIHLVRNLGHQRAIAVGLVAIGQSEDYDAVVIMDADGEDTPHSMWQLIEMHRNNPDHIIVAVRQKRQESIAFKLFYRLYKQLFHILVGKYIDFGNYCLIPATRLKRLIYDANIWNHLAAAIIRMRLPVKRVQIQRGKRYFGRSTMNFEALVIHGLSAISVFVDIVFLRLLIFSGVMAVFAGIGIMVVIGILLFTDLAIPGWATNAVGFLAIIILQMLIFSFGLIFFLLSQRASNTFIPALDVHRLIAERETLVIHE